MVREKEVREAEIWPWREGGVVVGEAAKASRSLRMEEDCLRAELKTEFWGGDVNFSYYVRVVWDPTMMAV